MTDNEDTGPPEVTRRSEFTANLKVYSGANADDFKTWIALFERIAIANKWTPERKCEVLPAFLSAHASDEYDQLTDDTKQDWDDLKRELTERLCPADVTSQWTTLLLARKQKTNESCLEYAMELKKLGRKAYPSLSTNDRDTLVKDIFLMNINPQLRTAVMVARPKTLQDAISIGTEAESFRSSIVNPQSLQVSKSSKPEAPKGYCACGRPYN